jgi:hypothetical protein
MKVKDRPIYTLNCEGRLPKQKTVIVFGLGRGGTSAVAGVLRELGVVLPNAHPLKHEWSPVCCHGNGEVDLASTLSNLHRFDNMHDVWGWKSPKDVFVLDQIESYIRNPVIVVVFRNLLESCLSGAKHDEFHWEICAEEHAAVQTRLARLVMYSPHPIAALSYETLIQDPAPVIAEFSDWLGVGLTEETMAAARAFVSSPAEYRSVSAHPHNGGFDTEEIARDRADAQVRLYLKAIEDMERSIVALAEDIQKARLVVEDLIISVHQLIDTHRNRLRPSAAGRIPLEFFSLSDADFVSALFMDPEIKMDGAPLEGSSEAEWEDSFPRELPRSDETDVLPEGLPPSDREIRSRSLYLRVLNDGYVNTRRNHINIVRERMLFQRKMDDLASKRELIRNLTKSD